VRKCMRMLATRGDIAKVEHIHTEFLRLHARALRVHEQELLNLPQLRTVVNAEVRHQPRSIAR